MVNLKEMKAKWDSALEVAGQSLLQTQQDKMKESIHLTLVCVPSCFYAMLYWRMDLSQNQQLGPFNGKNI